MTSKVSPTRISIKKIIKKQNAFIKDTSIILVYKVEEGKFTQLIENSKYVQSMDITNESQTKGKYFTITINTDYKNAVDEVKGMIKYVYLDREEDERQEYQRKNTPIIHSNVSTYAQALMLFHDDNSVPPKLLYKHLKIQFREQTPTTKRDARKEVTFIDVVDLTPVEEQQRFQPAPYIHPTSTNSGRGGMIGRGGYGERGNSDGRRLIIKDPVPLPHPWRNEVDNLLRDIQIVIMREIKFVITTAITTQISEIAIAMTTQIKTTP